MRTKMKITGGNFVKNVEVPSDSQARRRGCKRNNAGFSYRCKAEKEARRKNRTFVLDWEVMVPDQDQPAPPVPTFRVSMIRSCQHEMKWNHFPCHGKDLLKVSRVQAAEHFGFQHQRAESPINSNVSLS